MPEIILECEATLYYVRSSIIKQAVLEVNSTQGVYRAYIYAGGKLLAERTPDGNLYWLHTNHLGNSSRMTDQNGTMVYRGEFDPYGNLVYEWGLAGLNTRRLTPRVLIPQEEMRAPQSYRLALKDGKGNALVEM
ncbi:MAG: RHS domain-containing protein [Acidobacteria bacterium]|nr:RHS domain-containing protein [Acidobacteriota bacterium]